LPSVFTNPATAQQAIAGMSALPPKADIRQRDWDVRFVPILLQKSVAGLFGQ
jgi:hypothetical protein